MVNGLVSKMYKHRFNIIAVLFLILGVIFAVENFIVYTRLNYNGRRLDELSIGSLHRGIYIKDNMTYTYGNVGELTGKKSTQIYLVDIGSERNQYMEMLVQQSSFYQKDNDIEKLHTFFPGGYKVLNTSRKVKLYAIVEKNKPLLYDFYKELFNKKSDDLKNVVSKDYVIRVVNPDDYKRNMIGGIFLIILGGIVYAYSHLKNKKERINNDTAKDTENETEPKGLFSRGVLEGREVLFVELVWEECNIIFKEKSMIERIINALDDVVDESDDFASVQGNAICTFMFQLEDCTDIIFEMWAEKRIKSVGGFYYISENAYNELYDIWKGKVY
ncbi:MAG: hypothetical protein K2I03_12620 [Lachnospiraceae bacterium]|nr:hypothetical protein [Lachnospiraceae bacterium]